LPDPLPDESQAFETAIPEFTVMERQEWPDFIHHLVEDWPRLGSFLSAATLVAFKGHTVELRFASQFQMQFSEVTNKKNRDHILQELEKFFGRPVELHLTIEPKKETPLQAPAAPGKSDESRSIQDDMEREPIIKTVLDLFDGDVID
jgi:hypothetical protein